MVKDDVNIPADMLKAIGDCNEQCNAHIDNFTSKIDAQSVPDILYHYTDCKGLLGILKSGKIQLTDIFGLNDTSEVRHGMNHACKILDTETQGGHPAAIMFAKQFNEFKDSGIDKAAAFFVACFSCDDGDLGQWRAYGDNGSGFTIGFDGKLLENAFVKRDDERVPNNGTFSVTYDDDKLCEIYKQIVIEVLPLIAMPEERNLSNAIINEFMKNLFISLGILILRAAVLFKHEAYKNEQEYRFLQIRGIHESVDDLGYRARLNSLIRFTELDWKTKDQHVLREIVIGPAADENSAKSFAQDCLYVGGFDPDRVIIRKSGIPYRNT